MGVFNLLALTLWRCVIVLIHTPACAIGSSIGSPASLYLEVLCRVVAFVGRGAGQREREIERGQGVRIKGLKNITTR